MQAIGMEQSRDVNIDAGQTFSDAWKKAYPEAASSFEDQVFSRALYPHARVFAAVMRHLWPGYFRKDVELIRRISSLRTESDVRLEIDNFRYQNPEEGLLRGSLRLRVSCKRLIHLSRKVMKPE